MHDKEKVVGKVFVVYVVFKYSSTTPQKVLFFLFDMHVNLCMWTKFTYIKVKKQKVLFVFLVMWTVGLINKFVWLLQFQGLSNW